ncbi:glycosyltransferase [Streptomyces albus subsp. chlorinus]|uniref:glycosyltransferase family 2 protein n=1 Tax=Streptomyces albus TaxID=1888 RepID=UPI00156DEB56|nr:galactosyltransferase-related protein [Streptomyces albus]NSC24951.1 glycosyltransferase [Streptomyces albus subsp. chlorinus]
MSWRHQDPAALADAAVSSLALAADPFAQSAAPGFWAWSRDAHRAVTDAVLALPDDRVRTLAEAVAKAPDDISSCRRLTVLLADRIRRRGDDPDTARLAALVWDAETRSRLRMQTGTERPAGLGTPGAREILRTARPAARAAGPVDAALVVPFRERGGESDRTRNLAAVLHALNDQTHPRERYRIVVVEADSEPRWESVFAPYCDTYLFARNAGPFNYSWTINAGVVHGARPAGLICVLEADILVDRGFVERAVERFRVPGTQAHWPFEDILYLDGASSHQAVTERCLEGRAAVERDALRGVFLRRSPGACVWLRESLFTRIGGYDERFTAGWGGADNDFAWRADLHGGMDRYRDRMVHLHHARAADWFDAEGAGSTAYETFPWCSWPPHSAIGDLSKFRTH